MFLITGIVADHFSIVVY